ncbi:hypothetical protein D9619_010050 [Psilocybe cf. subviscida]|uniref:F-box domain-containing protein n=1 Tax=Psilocybe cf. subviscida TaxID=2480587 RepID=A0A8H5BKN2_9AGAR|nr:hypothetical protein D9619_010050 [Psilocybe cf. subviscida]
MDATVPYFETQRTLDEEISALRARTQNSLTPLLARRNALAPVFKLPNEILVDIFLILRNFWKPSLKCWHQVTQVCRHWRHVAIDAPILWTDIYVLSHEYTLLMLQRSQKAPLEVHFAETHFPSPHLMTTIPVVLAEIERIRTLSFTQKPSTFLETAQIFLMNQDRQALILENLNIECSESDPIWFNFSLDSFHPSASLRQLSLSSVQIDWNMLPITNLTHISFANTRTPIEVTGAQLMSALRPMVNLEELSIALDDIRLCHYGPNLQSIHLPCLKNLAVYSDRQDHIQLFLSYIIHPQLTGLLVHCLMEGAVVSSASIISSVAASMKKGNFDIACGLDIYQNDFRIYPEVDARASDKSSVLVTTPITADERGAETDCAVITDILTSIASLNSSNLVALRRIVLATELAIPAEQLIHLFGYLPQLQEMEVGGEMGLVLAEALAITCTRKDDNPPTDVSIAFPTLQSITWRSMKEYVSEKLLLPDVFQYIYTAMSMRLQSDCPISKLVLVEYHGLELSQFEALKDVVRRVDIRKHG